MKLRAYETDAQRCPFDEWFQGLDGKLRRAVQRRLRAIEESDHFGERKSLRGGLHELKFRQAICIYFAEFDGSVVLILGGSGKGGQTRGIAKARARLRDYKQRKQ